MNDRLLNGESWSRLLGIEIIEPKGWSSFADYSNRLITKSEYCNRAANSVLKTKIATTRREAAIALSNNFKNNSYGKQ